MAKSKKAIDKDMMFRKILPSLEDNPYSAAPAPEEPPAPKSDLAALREEVLGEGRQPAAVNVMEYLVLQRLDETVTRFHCCTCDRCRRAVAAAALCDLPPRYVSARPEDAAALCTPLEARQAGMALVRAVLRVRAQPAH